MRFNHSRLAIASSIVVFSAAFGLHVGVAVAAQQVHVVAHGPIGPIVWGKCLAHVRIYKLSARPAFTWPRSGLAARTANRQPKKEVLGFLAAALKWPAGDMPTLTGFRFARLGPKEVCLVAAWSHRAASQMEVACPAAGGGYWETSLPYHAPVPLAWAVTDLKGDGSREVISSQGGGSWTMPPLYWYTIYTFIDGLPRKVSGEFPVFYKTVWLPQLLDAEYLLRPPFARQPLPPQARFLKILLQDMRLTYQRRILGDKDAGLKQGLAWIKSPYNDVQGLGLGILADINDPQSIAALRKLGETTRNQGTCVDVVNALAKLEGRAPGGVVSDSADIKKILKCDEMKPSNPCLLQTGCVPPSADETK